MSYKNEVIVYVLILSIISCLFICNQDDPVQAKKEQAKETMAQLANSGNVYKRTVEQISNITAAEFITIRQGELARRELLWELYGKVHNLDLDKISTTVKRALRPFEHGIKREDVARACSLEEIDAICFFIINGTIKSRPPPTEKLKSIAHLVAKLLYRTQEALNDTLPDMIFVYNAMETPRVIPGSLPNNTLNATIGSTHYLSMLKKLCPKTVERYKAQGTHLAAPYKTFVIHEKTPVFSPSNLYGCSQDIPFPRHTFFNWGFRHSRLVDKHDDIPWDKKHDTLYWRGNFTGGYIASDTIQFFPVLGLLMQNSTDKNIAITHTIQNATKIKNVNGTMLYDAWAYKYLFDIDGDGASEVFAQLLAAGSVVLKHDPLYYEFYYDWLVPNLHFLPIYGDFSNLNATLEKLKKHPEMGKQIANETFKFYKTKFTKEAIYAYIYNLLSSYWWLHMFEYLPQKCEKCILYPK